MKTGSREKILDFKKTDAGKIIFVIVNMISFAMMYYLSLHTPLYSDDIVHATIEGTTPITNVNDILVSAEMYYQTWGGRIISRLIFQYLIAFNKPLYNILNAAIYVIYANLIQLYICFPLKIKRSNFSLILTYVMLWLFTPSFGGSYLWLTGSVTYLWLMVPILGLGFFYYRRWVQVYQKYDGVHKTESSIVRLGQIPAMFLLGIFAGCSIEAGMCTLLLGLLLFVFYMFKEKNRITIQEWAGIAGFVIGAGVLMLAPGNYARADTVSESANLLIRYGFRIARETYYACQYMLIPFGLTIALLLWNNVNSKEEINKKTNRKTMIFSRTGSQSVVMLVLSAFSIYVMTFSAVFATRIFITPLALNIIAFNILLLRFLGYGREEAVTTEEKRNNIFYKRQTVGTVILAVMVLYCMVQIATAVLVCSRNNIPIEKYITYNASDVENGVW